MNSRMRTYDVQTIDSTGAFLVGELERLDLTLHEPSKKRLKKAAN